MKKKPELDDLTYELVLAAPSERTATLLKLLDVARKRDRAELLDFAMALALDEAGLLT